MGLAVHLLGRPTVVGGRVAAPRGQKAWALLTYLLATEVPPSRSQLAGLLFSEAADPLRSLRWHLFEVRRVLGVATSNLGGDPVVLHLPAGTVVDIMLVRSGESKAALGLPGSGRELLEGMDFSDSPAFEGWLLIERRHLRAVTESLLREAALSQLAAGTPEATVNLAGRLVQLEPLSEEHRALLQRSLSACDAVRGAPAADPAEHEADAAAQRPTAHPERSPERLAPVQGRALAQAQLDAGQAAIAGGAFDRGVTCLRRAVEEAVGCAAAELQTAALIALGGALVHAGRGDDEEASLVLHRAIAVARGCGRPALASQAHWELGYIDFLRGRYTRAERWLDGAEQLAGHDGRLRAAVLAVRGACQADMGRYGQGQRLLDEAVQLAWRNGDSYRVVWSLTFLGRNHLLCGQLHEAATVLDRALDLTATERLTNLVPWPESFRAEVDLACGDVPAAEMRAQHAFALGCELDNPCWESIAVRSVALVLAAQGESTKALSALADGRERWSRLPGTYRWVLGYLLDAQCQLAIRHQRSDANEAILQLEQLAAPSGMRDLLLRAYVHRTRLGSSKAAHIARMLAAGIDRNTSPETSRHTSVRGKRSAI